MCRCGLLRFSDIIKSRETKNTLCTHELVQLCLSNVNRIIHYSFNVITHWSFFFVSKIIICKIHVAAE